MAKFNSGDRVRREPGNAGSYVQTGTIVAVLANAHGLTLFDQYEVDFGENGVLIAYESQLTAAD